MPSLDKKHMQGTLSHYCHGEHVEDGVAYRVLDAKKVYEDRKVVFDRYMQHAVRDASTYVWRPESGDKIVESNGRETTSQGNEIVFFKKLDRDGHELKVYIPSGSDGPLPESILDDKYASGKPLRASDELSIASYLNDVCGVPADTVTVSERSSKRNLKVDILHEVIDRPTIILNARGVGKHQAMQKGDSLKFEDGDCLPLPKVELDNAWQVNERAVGTAL